MVLLSEALGQLKQVDTLMLAQEHKKMAMNSYQMKVKRAMTTSERALINKGGANNKYKKGTSQIANKEMNQLIEILNNDNAKQQNSVQSSNSLPEEKSIATTDPDLAIKKL